MLRLGWQVRVSTGFTARLMGWDMTAALALGEALGVDRAAVAMLLPEIEQVTVEAVNSSLPQSDGDQG